MQSNDDHPGGSLSPQLSAPCFVVRLAVKIDGARADGGLGQLVDAFRESDAADAKIELRRVTLMDSITSGGIATMSAVSPERSGRVTLVGPSEQAIRLIEVVALDTLFGFEPLHDPEPELESGVGCVDPGKTRTDRVQVPRSVGSPTSHMGQP